MRITVNGKPLALEAREGGSLGEALSGADELIEKSGSVIVSLKVDGRVVDAGNFAEVSGLPSSSVASVEIGAEDSAAVRIRALETLLELLELAGCSAAEGQDDRPRDWPGIRAGATDMSEAFAGLFSADELSFVKLFSELLDRSGDEPDRASRIEISAQADRLRSFFSERLAELRDPAGEMRAAAALFAEKSSELAELPVLLQTGKEPQAMKSVLYFIEIFNKVIRVLPELRRTGIDTSSIRIEGLPLPEFYDSFNEVLRGLIDGLEHRDAVLIGDLAEYEVLPRMKSFFSSMAEALPAS
jgi:hypothetical protein